MTKLSIIIISWNTRQLLSACLHSIQAQLPAAGEINIETVVVDNNSSDGTPEMVRHAFPWIRLLENRENVGFAAANNQALRACQAEYLWLLNPDTALCPGALSNLLGFMAEHPGAGAAGSRLLNADGTLQPSCFPAPTLLRELWRLLHLDAFYPYGEYAMHTWPVDTVRQVDVVQGASLLIRRVVLDQVGLFDTDYFMYTEEVDLCYRIRKANWSIYWVPQSRVIHYGGQSTQQVARAMFLHLYHSKVLFFRKQKGKVAAQLYKVILLVVALARLTLAPLSALQSSYRRTRYMTLAGHYLRLVFNLPKM